MKNIKEIARIISEIEDAQLIEEFLYSILTKNVGLKYPLSLLAPSFTLLRVSPSRKVEILAAHIIILLVESPVDISLHMISTSAG